MGKRYAYALFRAQSQLTRPGRGGTLRRVETESHAELIEAIQRFLDDAARAMRGFLEPGGGGRADPLGELAALPTGIEANALARKASLAAGYLLPEPAGRPLDADALMSIGLFAMLINPSHADLQTVASDLAGYLAGPPVDIWDYAIIDGDVTPQDPILVVDGWELVTPSPDELRMLLPLPSIAAYQPDGLFDPDDYGDLAMLRRVNRDAAPHRGLTVHWDVLYSLAAGHPERLLWQPLTALSLYGARNDHRSRVTKRSIKIRNEKRTNQT
jgi:hypothetical protein